MSDMALAVDTCPQAELLLSTTRTRIDSSTSERISRLLKDIDWAELIQLARRHRVIPLLYRSLSSIWWENVPTWAMEEIRRLRYIVIVRNRLLTNELFAVLDTLGEHGVKAIPFKGPTLAKYAYGDVSLREFADLDILISKRDVLKATDLIVRQGYRLPEWIERAFSCRLAGINTNQFTFVSLQAGIATAIDVHWSVSQYDSFLDPAVHRLWERVETVRIEGREMAHLGPEDLLLVLSLHGSKHGWERLAWICDVAELLQAGRAMDWNHVFQEAQVLGISAMVSLGILLARRVLQAPVDESVLARVEKNRAVLSLGALVCKRLFRQRRSVFHSIEGFLFSCKVIDRPVHRLRHSLEYVHLLLAPSAKDRALVRLPSVLSFIYWLIRPVRYVLEHVWPSTDYSGVARTD